MIRLGTVLAAWSAILVVGFALVFTIGAPLPSEDQQRQAAYHPAPPVSREAAEAAAETIVRLDYPDFIRGEKRVQEATDFGIQRWIVIYSLPGKLAGVRVSITVKTGAVEVSTFP